MTPFGDGAFRVARVGLDVDAIRGLPGVRDVVIGEEHVLAVLEDGAPIPVFPRGEGTRHVSRLHVVRVVYDGPDLGRVAAWAGIPIDEVVRLHVGRDLEALAVGFLPGFAYLGPVDPRIAVPRHASPRPRVPIGAVAIGGDRTGVYPGCSPGGWNLVGRAVDFVAFDVETGATIGVGDRVRFEVA